MGAHWLKYCTSRKSILSREESVLGVFARKCCSRDDQTIGIDQRAGLQKLAQLVNLDFVIHGIQPLLRLLDRLERRCSPRRSQDRHRRARRSRTRAPVRRKWDAGGAHLPTGPRDLELLPKVAPRRLRRRRLRWCHGFTIQLGTAVTKRAATMVLPGWYCTATTEASVSSEPSELRRRRSRRTPVAWRRQTELRARYRIR